MILSGSSGSDAAPSVRRNSSDSSNLLLGNEPRLKKKKGKSQNYRKYLRRCVYSDQLSVMTHSDAHARGNKAAEKLDRYPHIHNVIFASWLAMSHSWGPVSLPEGMAQNQNGLVWLVRHLMSGEVVLGVYPKRGLSSLPASLSFALKLWHILSSWVFTCNSSRLGPVATLKPFTSPSLPFICRFFSFWLEMLYFLG